MIGSMKISIKKIIRQVSQGVGAIACLSDDEKKKLQEKGYTVRETETPCGSSGNQIISQ